MVFFYNKNIWLNLILLKKFVKLNKNILILKNQLINIKYNNFLKIFNDLLNYNKKNTTGFLIFLELNGLGFRFTRKIYKKKYIYLRFNLGFSHIYKFFSPKNIIIKNTKNNIYFFSFNKIKMYDITNKIKSLKKFNVYKGTGIKYPDELKISKLGKIKQ